MAKQAASKAVKRVYVVTERTADQTDPTGKDRHFLVRAGSQAQAVSYIVRGRFTAEAASTDDVLRLRDVEVQDAGSDA